MRSIGLFIMTLCFAAAGLRTLSRAAEPTEETTSLVILYTGNLNGQLEACE